MIEYTKPLLINNKVKVGKVLPDNAIELCKFDNNINKNKVSNSVSFLSERNLSQFKMAKDYLVVLDLNNIDDSVFPITSMYSDENDYSGIINFKNSIWKKRSSTLKENKTITINGTYSSASEIPKTISKTIDGFNGTLSLSSINIKSTSTASSTVLDFIKYKTMSLYKENDNNNFSDTVSVSATSNVGQGYEGMLKLNSIICMFNQGTSSISVNSIISGKINGSFPRTINKDGKIYLPTGKFIDKTEIVETWVKHYGVCRYWGGGGSSSNNYYGDPDYRFNVDRWTAKGYMNGIPAPTLDRYGHKINMVIDHRPDKYPIDTTNGYWDRGYNETDGIKWTYDIEEAAKYGGSTDPGKGGVVWASDYWRNSGGVWPPSGYENDYLGSDHISSSDITYGNSSTINHNGKLCVKAGAQKTSLAGFYNYGGFYCKWFRQVILFYKGLTTRTITIQEGNYESATITPGTNTVKYKAVYIGKLSKKVYKENLKDVSMNIDATYDGVLSKTITKYDGKAYYEGIVYKKVFIDNHINTVDDKVLLFVDSDGYLKYTNNSSNSIKSQYIHVTNISKDGIPLLYTNKIKNRIYIPSGPTKELITSNNYVDLIYDKFVINDIVFLTKLIPTSIQDYYSIELYTNKLIGCTDNVSVSFSTSENEIIYEQITSQYIYNQNIDYSSERIDDVHYKFRFGEYVAKNDERRKIHFNYIISTNDGTYTSNTRSASIVNIKYALESERQDFLQDKMCISPIVNQDRMTAKEILALDCNIDINTLKEKKINVRLQESNYRVDLYTDSSGDGYIYASTYEDTGTLVDGEYTGKENDHYISISNNGIIYNAYYVVLENQSSLGMYDPYSNNVLTNWYSRFSYAPFDLGSQKNNTNVKATYSLNEYINSTYHSMGMPYKRYIEQPIVLNEFSVKMSRNNILFMFNNDKEINNSYFTLYDNQTGQPYTITSFDSNSSIATTKESIVNKDTIECSYIYAEKTYEYKGFTKDNVFYHLDLNPNVTHTYTDVETLEERPTYNLFNNTIYLFLKPSIVKNTTTNEIIENNTSLKCSLYHKVNNPEPSGLYDILVGIIAISPTFSILNTDIIKTSLIGGGIKPKYIKANKEHLDGFFDINEYSEKAIQKNATVIIKTSNEFITKDNLLKLVDKYIPVGILPIVKE